MKEVKRIDFRNFITWVIISLVFIAVLVAVIGALGALWESEWSIFIKIPVTSLVIAVFGLIILYYISDDDY